MQSDQTFARIHLHAAHLDVAWVSIALTMSFVMAHFNYLLYHTLAEFFAISVAVIIFVVAINSQLFKRNDFFLFLGIGYLYVGSLDLVHTLAFRGMGVFDLPEGDNGNVSAQLWILARYVEAATLLVSTSFLGTPRATRPFYFLFAFISVAGLASILVWPVFPVCIGDGTGLTTFKVASEYLVISLLIFTMARLWKKRELLLQNSLQYMFKALSLTILAELSFTLYSDAYGLFNMTGHALKILSFYYVYRALVSTGFLEPYSQLFRQLKESRDRHAEAQRIAHLGHWSWNIPTGGLEWSEEIYRIFGLDPQQFTASYEAFLERVHPDDRPLVEGAVHRAVEEDAPYDIHHRLVRPDGEVRMVREIGLVVHDPAGIQERMLGTVLDITETELIARQLEEAKQRAEEASQAKSLFLSNMSHEIRTPLNAVLGMIQVIQEMPVEPEVGENLAIIRHASETLLMLINDILELSRIESGRLELDEAPFDLRNEFSEICEGFSVSCRLKGISLVHEVSPDLPHWLVGDVFRLRQILYNLIGNAIKFTNQGQVALRADWVPCGGAEPELALSVTDTGTGIAADKQQAIFESFTQEDARVAQEHGGTGLGLTISRRLAELMGGWIELDSKVGRGSCFTVHLPLTQGRSDLVEGQASWTRPELSGRRLLLVEDQESAVQVLRKMLNPEGVELVVASNGIEALAILERGIFDLVLMDLRLPKMDGYKTTEAIRQGTGQVSDPGIPILAVTAKAFSEDKERCFAVGMNGVVVKPIEKRKLLGEMDRLLKERKQTQE